MSNSNEEKLKMFLYVLMRDKIPSGDVEDIMRNFIGAPLSTSLNPNKGFEFKIGEYSNKYLEAHVLDIMTRLK